METERESSAQAVAELVAQLFSTPEAKALAAAELVAGAGWLGLRGHPRPVGSVVYGGPTVPDWFDQALREIVGATGTNDAGYSTRAEAK
jgi:hypothetical protein